MMRELLLVEGAPNLSKSVPDDGWGLNHLNTTFFQMQIAFSQEWECESYRSKFEIQARSRYLEGHEQALLATRRISFHNRH
jgi:hypothetical protein